MGLELRHSCLRNYHEDVTNNEHFQCIAQKYDRDVPLIHKLPCYL